MVVGARRWWARKWPSIGLCVVPYRLFTCLHRRTSLMLREKVYLPLALWNRSLSSALDRLHNVLCASASTVVVADSVGTWCALHWIALKSSESTESVNRIQEGNLLTEECVSTTLSFIVALASKTLLHNIRQCFATVSSKSVKVLRCHGNSKLLVSLGSERRKKNLKNLRKNAIV